MRMSVVLPVASSRLLKKTHLRRCAPPPRSGWLIDYGLERMVPWFHLYAISDQPYAIPGARLASGIFLISLESGFQPLFIHCPLRAEKDF